MIDTMMSLFYLIYKADKVQKLMYYWLSDVTLLIDYTDKV